MTKPYELRHNRHDYPVPKAIRRRAHKLCRTPEFIDDVEEAIATYKHWCKHFERPKREELGNIDDVLTTLDTLAGKMNLALHDSPGDSCAKAQLQAMREHWQLHRLISGLRPSDRRKQALAELLQEMSRMFEDHGLDIRKVSTFTHDLLCELDQDDLPTLRTVQRAVKKQRHARK